MVANARAAAGVMPPTSRVLPGNIVLKRHKKADIACRAWSLPCSQGDQQREYIGMASDRGFMAYRRVLVPAL